MSLDHVCENVVASTQAYRIIYSSEARNVIHMSHSILLEYKTVPMSVEFPRETCIDDISQVI